MSGRIEERFTALGKAKRKALITFIMGGDPDKSTSAKILASLPTSGADLIEIGMPFSDPMADGAIIEAAGLRALAAGTKLKDIFAMVTTFRKTDDITPIILMGYYNPVYNYGIEQFCKDAKLAGVDGVILVDLPPEEEDEFTVNAEPYGIRLIRLITPTTNDARLARILKKAGGFLYYVAVAGITGTKSADMESLKTRVNHIKSKTALPIAVGFGIKTPEQVAHISKFSDGVVVGSALVEKIATQSLAEAMDFVKSLKSNLDSSL